MSRSHHGDFDPQLVVNGMQQSLDMDEAYQHFALAYQYLDNANGRDTMLKLIRQTKATPSNSLANQFEIDKEDPRFRRSFNTLIHDMQGNPLTLEQWRNNYHVLINEWQD